MILEKINIVDNFFSHASSSSWYNQPNNFVWERNLNSNDSGVVVTTTLNLIGKLQNKKVYGWLLESPALTPHLYDFAKSHYQKFESIFTFDKELLNISEKFVFVPLGGCWIDSNERVITEKCKLISMVYSDKKQLEGHKLRHKVAKNIDGVDLFGTGYKSIPNKSEALKEYMFSIVIENCKKDYYFSEKLIDCFITGTIPIYWGCPSIGDFFNQKGILSFNTISDLKQILSNINQEYYDNLKEVVFENYEKSKKYLIADDIIYEKLKYGK